MKVVLFIVAGLFPLFSLAQNSIFLHGRLIDAQDGETTIMFITQERQSGEQYLISLQEDGSFSLHIPLTEAGYAWFKHGEERTTLYLEPGDSLWLQLDSKSFDESLVFQGKGAGNDNYLAAHYLEFEDMENGKFPSSILLQKYGRTTDPMEFKIKAKELELMELEFMKSFATQLSEQYRTKRALELQYKWKSHVLDFPKWRGYFTQDQEKPFKWQELDPTYFDFLDTVQLNNEAAEGLPDYHDYIANLLVQHGLLAGFKVADVTAMFDYQMRLATAHLKGYSLEKLQLDLLREHLFKLNLDKMQPYFRVLAESPNQAVRQKSNELSVLASRLAPGQAVNLKLTNQVGQEVELSSYKGKVLYIDFWASWCVPCIKEFPNSKALQEHYKDSPELVFLYISLDDEKDAWETALEKHQPQGEHFWVPGFNEEVPKYFDINAIPRYVLIDKQGKIIRSDAPRPGSEALKKLLDTALIN